ncbi:hypothetical protein [Flavobacterium dankookense]|uniref:hypothetical protein n=1 Tax=Flavobacterium dankookense TaxID=706186 RepID=UPI001B85BEDE|nr:hypothetical protein [Flavobacterium dankookense]
MIDQIKKGANNFAAYVKKIIDDFFKWLEDLLKSGKADEVFETGKKFPTKLVVGKYSKRTFDINNCGGKILNLSWKEAKITKEGIDVVKKHLSRFETDIWNERMIDRLERVFKNEIELTDFDKRFFTHETREFERYKVLGHEKTTYLDMSEKDFAELWENTHSATLEDYKVFEKIRYDDKTIHSLYHPDVQF